MYVYFSVMVAVTAVIKSIKNPKAKFLDFFFPENVIVTY